MMQVIKKLLLKIVDDIDAGNSVTTETEETKITRVLQQLTDKTMKMSKYQACQYLNISRATFDNYVRSGKLPKGSKQAGFKELFWVQKDLYDFYTGLEKKQ